MNSLAACRKQFETWTRTKQLYLHFTTIVPSVCILVTLKKMLMQQFGILDVWVTGTTRARREVSASRSLHLNGTRNGNCKIYIYQFHIVSRRRPATHRSLRSTFRKLVAFYSNRFGFSFAWSICFDIFDSTKPHFELEKFNLYHVFELNCVKLKLKRFLHTFYYLFANLNNINRSESNQNINSYINNGIKMARFFQSPQQVNQECKIPKAKTILNWQCTVHQSKNIEI